LPRDRWSSVLVALDVTGPQPRSRHTTAAKSGFPVANADDGMLPRDVARTSAMQAPAKAHRLSPPASEFTAVDARPRSLQSVTFPTRCRNVLCVMTTRIGRRRASRAAGLSGGRRPDLLGGEAVPAETRRRHCRRTGVPDAAHAAHVRRALVRREGHREINAVVGRWDVGELVLHPDGDALHARERAAG